MAIGKVISLCAMLSLYVVSSSLFSEVAPLPFSQRSPELRDGHGGLRLSVSSVNWTSHSSCSPRGVPSLPLQSLGDTVRAGSCKCVRLSWTSRMFTNKMAGDASTSQVFGVLGLHTRVAAAASFNGKLAGIKALDAFKEVVQALRKQNLMVLLDNRAIGDDNEMQIVVSLFKHEVNSSEEDWSSLMRKGCEAIHRPNSGVLLIRQPCENGKDSHYRHCKKLRRKVVFHICMKQGDAAKVRHCATLINQYWKNRGISSNSAHPGPILVVLSRLDLSEVTASKIKTCFWACFISFYATSSMDIVMWNSQGVHHLQQGVDDDEKYGFLFRQWTPSQITAPASLLQAVGPNFQDTAWRPRMLLERSRLLLFHPSTGLCVNKIHVHGLQMGSCNQGSSWKLSPQGLLVLDGSYLVIGANGPEQTAVLELQGQQANGPWNVSSGRMQISTVLMGHVLCLDTPKPPALLTNPCACSDTSLSSVNALRCEGTPASQRFTFTSTLDR